MKRLILIFATLAMTFHGIAQEKYVTAALVALNGNNLDEAKEDIDKAMASPETMDKPKALFAKAQIYFAMQLAAPKYSAGNPYREGAQVLFKLIEVKPDYEKKDVDQLLAFAAFYYFNDGVKAFNDKKYTESTDLMKNVVKIIEMKSTRFKDMPDSKKFDTVAADAYQTLANSYYYASKYDEAIPLLIKVKNNPITKTPTAFECLIDAYTKQKNNAEAYNVIEEGRKAFPEDVTIRNYELNYYIISGKQDELVKKLEEAAAKEPNNSDILFNIATTYLGMANPSGKDAKKPANAAELTAKSEDAFQRALKLAPDNASYNYNFGALYYNEATDINDQMNAITGSSDADLKKYDGLKAKRDAMFDKAMPYFEKAYSVLSVNESGLKGDDLKTYKSTLSALKVIYAMQNKVDKSTEMRKKLESLH